MAEFPVKLDGQTYDLQKFLKDHPGGTNTLKNYKGRSILEAMKKFGHSVSAYHMLKDFKVTDSNLTGAVSENGRIITKEEEDRDVAEIEFLEKLESQLDWSKSILRQMDIVAPHYNKWVNSAVYRRCRLFESPLLENLTYSPWYLVPLFWVPVMLYIGVTEYHRLVLCSEACGGDPMSVWRFCVQIALGMLMWTSLEYSLHRWVFHLDPGTSLNMIKLHFLIHGLHHKTPFDGLRQVFPPFPAAILAWVLYTPASMIFTYPRLLLVGNLIGYLTYDMIHYYVHHGSPKDGTYLYAMKRYHSNHHFVNHDKAFGISSNIWDHVFKTFVHVRRLGFSLQW
ncbi:uncharacterized protein LOC126370105 [Pectinophora gossypiella]|nr:uncharacterized protein LOC126370105 [Pectinophora gossypiella]